MILTKTPFRISFFGGGTDFPSWYLTEGGATLSTTIDKYCYISCRVLPPFFQTKHRIVWSYIESVPVINDILHPAVRLGLNYMGLDDSTGIEIHHQSDLPARSGVGSSSAFVVGLISALALFKGKKLSKHQLAQKAIELEQNVLKESVGSQDQIAASYGGFNQIEFHSGGEFQVHPVALPADRLAEFQSKLLLFYTGSARNGIELAAKVISNIPKSKPTLRLMRQMVDEGMNILTSNQSLSAFGSLLHEGWALKQQLNSAVSNPYIDSIYEKAIKHGALGGKVLGSGGSGFILFYVPEERRQKVIKALANCFHVPFCFEREGTSVLCNAGVPTRTPVESPSENPMPLFTREAA